MFLLSAYLFVTLLFVLYGLSLRMVFNQENFDWTAESLSCEAKEWFGTMMIFPLQVGWFNTLPPPRSTKQPILFLPGYALNRLSFWPLQRYLRTCGWSNSWAINHPILTDSIDAFLEHIHQCVQELHWRTEGQKVILIGHSMGGLLANRYIAQYGNDAVAAMITIGTPWKGSYLSTLGFGNHASIITPKNEHLRESTPPSCPHLCVFSPRDSYVLPSGNADVEGFNSVSVASAGHISMLFSQKAFVHIRDFLATLSND